MESQHLATQPRTVITIRVSSAIMAGLTIGHMLGYPWRPAEHGPNPDLASTMKTTQFVFMGQGTSYWDLYLGLGLLAGLLLLSLAITLWLLADVARVAPRGTCMIAGTLAVICLAGAYLSYEFFFLPPTLAFAAIGVTLASATSQLWRPVPELGGAGGSR